jgi:hypothetical protein
MTYVFVGWVVGLGKNLSLQAVSSNRFNPNFISLSFPAKEARANARHVDGLSGSGDGEKDKPVLCHTVEQWIG